MPAQRPITSPGSYFLDSRGDERGLRVSWHLENGIEDGVVVLSLWRDNVCTGSFRLGLDDVPDLVRLLSTGLGRALAISRQDVAEHAATG